MESMNNAEKTLIHISHLHPLKLTITPEPRPICLACNMQCADKSFGCAKCRYYLHVTCATTKKRVDHPGHTDHTLAFELTPTYSSGKFGCNACGDEGNTFGLKCKACDYDLHLHCAALPHRVKHPSHSHPLCLMYESPYPSGTRAICTMCERNLEVSTWFYLCKGCDVGGHVECYAPETVEVISPGLRAPPPPPPQPQPQQQAPVQAMTNHDLQMQLMAAQARASQSMMIGNALHNAGNMFRYTFDNVQYRTNWM